jgi:rhodanese-related sulfurtransferase
MNPYAIPGITVQEVAAKRANGNKPLLLDVREPYELQFAHLGEDVLLAPMSLLSQQLLDGLPTAVRENQDAEIIVFCHHGFRSAQVVAFLQQNGWANVLNMEGGIDAYADIDESIGRY